MLDLWGNRFICNSSLIASCIGIACFLSPIEAEEVYCGRHETLNLDRAKTPRFNDRKRVHIVNIEPFTIVESREFSRGSKSKFHADRSIKLASSDLIILEKPKINFLWVQNYFNSISSETDPEEIVDFLISLRTTLIGLGYATPTLQELCERLSNSSRLAGDDVSFETLSTIYEIILEKESGSSSKFVSALFQQKNYPNIRLVKHEKKVFKQNLTLSSALLDSASKVGMPIRQYLDLVIEQLKSGLGGNIKDEQCLMKYAIKWRDYLDHPNEYMVYEQCNDAKDRGVIALCEILAGALLMIVPYPPVQVIGGALVTHGLTNLADAGEDLSSENKKKLNSSEKLPEGR